MAAKIIDELEIAFFFFLAHTNCHNGIGYKEKVEKENLDSGMVVGVERKGAYNEIFNELRLNEF